MKKFVSKLAQSGFNIILFLCIAAIGVSAYVMYLARDTADTVSETVESSFEIPFPSESETVYDFGTEIELPEIEDVEEPKKEETAPKTEVKKAESEKPKEQAEPTISVQEKEETVYTMAVNGAITEPFSDEELVKSETMGDWRIHAGVDIKGSLGNDVKAIAHGTVKSVETDTMMGNTVKILHADGIMSIYANLADGITLKAGDIVKSGDVVGKIGNSALAECLEEPHLHLEVTKNGKNIDPLSLYPAGEE